MDPIVRFLANIRQLGITIGRPRTRVIGDAAGLADDADLEELLVMSKPAATPWVDARRPLAQVIMTGKGPRNHRGSLSVDQAPAPKDEGDGGVRKPRGSAAALRKKIEKLQRDIRKVELENAKKTGQNRTK